MNEAQKTTATLMGALSPEGRIALMRGMARAAEALGSDPPSQDDAAVFRSIAIFWGALATYAETLDRAGVPR